MEITCQYCGFVTNDDDDKIYCPSCTMPLKREKREVKVMPNENLVRMVKFIKMIDDQSLYNCAVYELSRYNNNCHKDDMKNIIAILNELALRGNAEGMYLLADIYLSDEKYNKEEALKWLFIASKKGHEKSKIRLSMYENEGDIENLKKNSGLGIMDLFGRSVTTIDTNFSLKNILRVECITTRNRQVGTAFIIDGNYLVTNAHVVTSDYQLVKLSVKFDKRVDSNEYTVKILKIDKARDIAIMQFNGLMQNKIEKYEHFKLDLSELEFGEFVYTIGNSQGVNLRYSQGTVGNPSANAEHREVDDIISLDINFQHGNSGGPLLDSNNKVRGITTFSIHGQENDELNYAIKAKYIVEVINEM